MEISSFYNSLEINQPPHLSFRLCCKNPEIVGQKLLYIIRKAVKILKDMSTLHKESATLSRLIYRWKWRMRNDKGFRALEKVNRSLLQYLALDFVNILEKVLEQCYDDYGPSKQILEWVLVRLQGFSKLFDNIYNRCMNAASYLRWRFQTGHVWCDALIGTAVISRIWLISQYLVKESVEWYNHLKQILPVLQPSMQQWLPSGYILPDELGAWLGNPEYLSNRLDSDNKLFSFLKENDKKEDHQTTPANERSEFNSFDTTALPGILTEDIGEKILRTDIDCNSNDDLCNERNEINNSKRIKSDNNNYQLPLEKIDCLTTLAKLLRFVKNEKLLRKLNSDDDNRNKNICLTSNMDKLQWRMFQKFIKDKIHEIRNEPNNKKKLLNALRNDLKVWILS